MPHRVAVLADGIAGVAFNGVNTPILHLLHNPGMVGKPVLPVLIIPVKEDNHAGGCPSRVCVDMGTPELARQRIPVRPDTTSDPESPCIGQPIRVLDREWAVTCVSMGNPHAVVFVDDVDSLDLPVVGPAFEHHPWFPSRTNTEFVQLMDAGHVRMRVWERGAGETLACGTGACAVAVACHLTGRTGREVAVQLRGGTLDIRWDERTGHVLMTGPARTVFSGEYSPAQGQED